MQTRLSYNNRSNETLSTPFTRLRFCVLCISFGWIIFLSHYFRDNHSAVLSYDQLSVVDNEKAIKLASLAHQWVKPRKEERTISSSDRLAEGQHGSLRKLEKTKKKEPTKKAKDDDTCPHGIVALTYASHGGSDDRFCRTLESAIRNHVPLRVLGWNVPWEGLSQKLKASHDTIQSFPDDCIVLFTDGFDVLFLDSLHAMKTSFGKMNVPLLFSGECGCWPQISRGVDACFEKYPKAPTLYRYLNSGSWIGYAKNARELLSAVMREGLNDVEEGGKEGFHSKLNDQELLSDMYIAGRFNISLDHYARIFQSVHSTDAPLETCHPAEDHLFEKDGYWYNQYTNSRPAIFHFNGGGKRHHLSMESQAWYKKPAFKAEDDINAILDHILQMGDARLMLREVCPPIVYQIGS